MNNNIISISDTESICGPLDYFSIKKLVILNTNYWCKIVITTFKPKGKSYAVNALGKIFTQISLFVPINGSVLCKKHWHIIILQPSATSYDILH